MYKIQEAVRWELSVAKSPDLDAGPKLTLLLLWNLQPTLLAKQASGSLPTKGAITEYLAHLITTKGEPVTADQVERWMQKGIDCGYLLVKKVIGTRSDFTLYFTLPATTPTEWGRDDALIIYEHPSDKVVWEKLREVHEK